MHEAVTPLQAARLARGWTQAQVIFALTQQAKAARVPIADGSSLKTMLSRWENGRGHPDATYQRLFCHLFGLDMDELGFSQPLTTAPALRVAPTVNPSTVEYFKNIFHEHVKADNLMGPHHLVEVVRAQTVLLDQILTSAQDGVRRELLRLARRYSEFTGWLYQDAGDPSNAMVFTDRAMDYALEFDDPQATSYILMRKSNIAGDLGKPDRALGLVSAALRNAGKVPPRVRALILGQRARAHASLSDAPECERAIDLALQEVSRPDADSDMAAAYCNEAYILMGAAAAFSALGKPDKAIPVFEHSLASWPEYLRRDKGLCLVRLATAYAASGDPDRAATTGRDAVTVIRSATSGRSLLELMQLRRHLAPWRRNEDVSDLCEQIRGLTKTSA